jgi:hypothetical protein
MLIAFAPIPKSFKISGKVLPTTTIQEKSSCKYASIVIELFCHAALNVFAAVSTPSLELLIAYPRSPVRPDVHNPWLEGVVPGDVLPAVACAAPAVP